MPAPLHPAPEAGASLERHRGALERLARRLVWDAEEARDVVQAAFADALAARAGLASPAAEEAWLRRIVLNRALSHLRRRRLWRAVAAVLLVAEEPVAAPPEEDAERRAHQAALARALERRPARQAMAFTLRYLEGQSLDEVAEALGISRATVRVHLQRAVKALREEGVL